MATKALCIGINDYPGTGMDLQGCVNDAQDWARELQQRGFGVTTLLDAQATKAAMAQAMGSLIEQGQGGDVLVITYSGHGTYVPDTDGDEVDGLDEALCPHDIRTEGALLDDEIHELFLRRQPKVKLVLVADSCHSGTVTRAAADPDADPRATRPRFMPIGNWMEAAALPRALPAVQGSSPLAKLMLRRSGDLLLAGCQEGPQSLQLRRPHRRPLQRRLHLLRAQGAARPGCGRDLCAVAQGHHAGHAALGELPAKPAARGRCRGAALQDLCLNPRGSTTHGACP